MALAGNAAGVRVLGMMEIAACGSGPFVYSVGDEARLASAESHIASLRDSIPPPSIGARLLIAAIDSSAAMISRASISDWMPAGGPASSNAIHCPGSTADSAASNHPYARHLGYDKLVQDILRDASRTGLTLV